MFSILYSKIIKKSLLNSLITRFKEDPYNFKKVYYKKYLSTRDLIILN